jgi:hypothetical protein
MAPTTRNQTGTQPSTPTTTTALEYVLATVLNAADQSSFRLALVEAGVTTITDFVGLDKADFSAIRFPGPTPTAENANATTPKSLSIVEVKKLLQLNQWYRQQANPTFMFWFDCTAESFETFRDAPTSTPETEIPATRTTLTGAERDLATFEKGRRRNITDFPKITEEKNWSFWKRRTETIAAVNGLANVLESSYVPEPGPATTLFKGQMDFMYAAFEFNVQTAEGRLIVREHTTDRDAQTVFKKLVLKHEDGTAALLAINEIRTAITKLLLRDWKQPIVSFLLKFKTLILDLDGLTKEPVDEYTKRTWLETSLIGHVEMTNAVASIRSTALLIANMKNTDGSSTKTEFSYEHFFTMMNEHAIRLDGTQKIVAKTQRQNHQTDRKETKDRDRTGGRGRGEFQSGRGKGGRGSGGYKGSKTKHPDHLPDDEYLALSYAERNALYHKRKQKEAAKAGRDGGGPSLFNCCAPAGQPVGHYHSAVRCHSACDWRQLQFHPQHALEQLRDPLHGWYDSY